MTLSFYSNWGTLQHQYLNPEPPPPELFGCFHDDFTPELFDCFHHDFTLGDTCINPLFESTPNDNHHLNTNNNNFDFPPPSNNTNQVFFSSPEFLLPKRQKGSYNYDDDQIAIPSFFDECVYYSTPVPNFLPENILPGFSTTNYDCGRGGGGGEDSNKVVLSSGNGGGGGGGSLSAQSMAVRRRRKKITEKTEELGKLIPGGKKMNTAEMFHAAFKYVKFLQAQVGILQFMGSIQMNDEPLYQDQDLYVLVLSPVIQEMLYSKEKCLVPERFVELESNQPFILKD